MMNTLITFISNPARMNQKMTINNNRLQLGCQYARITLKHAIDLKINFFVKKVKKYAIKLI